VTVIEKVDQRSKPSGLSTKGHQLTIPVNVVLRNTACVYLKIDIICTGSKTISFMAATAIDPADSPFETVYGIPELGTEVMDLLALPHLTALSYTSRMNYIRAQHYLRHKLARIYAPFGLTRDDVMRHLLFSEAFIVGSIALKAVAPATWPIVTNNIDVVVQAVARHVLERWLLDHGYSKCRKSNRTFSGYNAPFQCCHSYTKGGMDVNLMVVDRRTEGYDLIFHASNTAGMNMLSPRGLFAAYRTLLNHQLVVPNNVSNMVSMRTVYRSVQLYQNWIDKASNSKAVSRGFTFLTPDPSPPHPSDCCLCPYVSACLLMVRNMNDSMCSYMRILGDAELQSFSVIHQKRRPTVIWRLADVEEGSQGFAFPLTYSRINSMP
jgi:hypothetical protein